VAVSTTGEVVGTLVDGRTIVKVTHVHVVGSGTVWVELTVPILEKIDAILDLEIKNTDPKTGAYGITHKTITGNIVGFTIHEVVAGTTLTTEGAFLGH